MMWTCSLLPFMFQEDSSHDKKGNPWEFKVWVKSDTYILKDNLSTLSFSKILDCLDCNRPMRIELNYGLSALGGLAVRHDECNVNMRIVVYSNV